MMILKTYHIELQALNGEAVSRIMMTKKSYTLKEILFERHMLIPLIDDWSIRAGKQQVVWGTADGMKFLILLIQLITLKWLKIKWKIQEFLHWMINAEKIFKMMEVIFNLLFLNLKKIFLQV